MCCYTDTQCGGGDGHNSKEQWKSDVVTCITAAASHVLLGTAHEISSPIHDDENKSQLTGGLFSIDIVGFFSFTFFLLHSSSIYALSLSQYIISFINIHESPFLRLFLFISICNILSQANQHIKDVWVRRDVCKLLESKEIDCFSFLFMIFIIRFWLRFHLVLAGPSRHRFCHSWIAQYGCGRKRDWSMIFSYSKYS